MKRVVPVFNDLAHLLRALTLRRVINLLETEITWFAARYFRIIRFPSGPWAASFEPTTSCNLRCPECPSGLRAFKRPTGKADIEQFREWAKQLASTVAWLNLYFQGEPLLHHDLGKILQIARQLRFYTALSTNGHFLTEENCRTLIENKLSRLIISLDGLDQKSYEKYRRGGDLAMVLEGIERMVRIRKRMKAKYPYIVVQFLVFRSNEHQISELFAHPSLRGVDAVVLKSAQFYRLDEDQTLLPEKEKYSRYRIHKDGSYSVKSKLPNHCHRFWSSAVITWDGKVLPCCFDKDADHVLGNLQKQPFHEIWRSHKRQSFAKGLFTHRRDIDICGNCDQGLRI